MVWSNTGALISKIHALIMANAFVDWTLTNIQNLSPAKIRDIVNKIFDIRSKFA